jgi:hypothetical protein
MTKKYVNLDAQGSVFFARELEHVKSKTYDVKYPELKQRAVLPVSFEAGPGAESITYRQYDMIGFAKIISNYAKDLPRADVSGAEFTSPIKSLGASFGYTVQEIRSAQMAGRPLEARRASSVRRAFLQTENEIAFFGNPDANLKGFLNHVNLNTYTVPNDGAMSGTTWASKTPDQILRDMSGITSAVIEQSKGVEVPDTLLLPLTSYNQIVDRPRSANSDTTIMKYFLDNNPHINNIMWLNELETAGAMGVKRMIAYKRSPDAVTLEIPQDFEQFSEQEQGLEFVVPCHQRIGGVILYYPLSTAFGDGI